MALRRAPLSAFLFLCAARAGAQGHGDPDRTVTIVFPGFSDAGATTTGTFGEDVYDDLLGNIAGLVGAATILEPDGRFQPDLVTMCNFYGDQAPSYYSAADLAELDAVTQQFGGGVPRYALIMAKFTEHVLQRTGADHANLAGASFGALVSRYMVQHDLEGLTSGGRIVRWQTLEGVTNGNWEASNGVLFWLWQQFAVPSIDVEHMRYPWVEANLNAPRDRMTSALLGDVLVGHTTSTRDTATAGALSAALILFGEFDCNDGVIVGFDSAFTAADPPAMYRGRPPTRSWHPADHYTLEFYRGGWASVAAFMTGDTRFTARLVKLRLRSLPEGGPFSGFPAEVVVDTVVTSPQAVARWGITEAMSARDFTGGCAPLHEVQRDQWQTVDQVVYDDFVVPGEAALDLAVFARELDWDTRYGVFELSGGVADIGGGGASLPIADGLVQIATPAFDLLIETTVQKYPMGRALWLEGVADPDRARLPLSGARQELALDFGPSKAGLRYRVYGGYTGTTPGLDLGHGVVLPLHPDRYTSYVLATLNGPLHHAFEGQLDARGRAVAVLNDGGGAFDPRARGADAVYAAAVFDAGGVAQAGSNAVLVEIR